MSDQKKEWKPLSLKERWAMQQEDIVVEPPSPELQRKLREIDERYKKLEESEKVEERIQELKEEIHADELVHVEAKWNGYDVYVPKWHDMPPRMGFPQFILAKGEEVRMTDGEEECFDVLHFVNQFFDDEEDEEED